MGCWSCKYAIDKDLIKDFDFHYVLLIFIVNTLGLSLWKSEKGIRIINAFQEILNEFGGKTNKIRVNKSSFSLSS